jgi:hypothetical protein
MSEALDPKTRTKITPRKQPGYYPGYSTLKQQKFWDAHTREVVLKRVKEVPPIRFFTQSEARLMTAVVNCIVPQDDRDENFRIPITNHIDERLYANRIDGYRYEDMPPDQEAHRLGLRAIDETAIAIHSQPFVELDRLKQDFILKSLHDGKKLAAPQIWSRMNIERYWRLLVQDCVQAYYSHPWAWDEIGYGGPAYPRAYMRLENGEPEPWEVEEQRYEWAAPINSISDRYEPARASDEQHSSHPGRGGTH